MRRRDFLALLGSAAATWPLAARAQPPAKIARIGILDDAPMWQAFRQALRELGYVEGQNIAYEYRYGDGRRIGWRRSRRSWCAARWI